MKDVSHTLELVVTAVLSLGLIAGPIEAQGSDQGRQMTSGWRKSVVEGVSVQLVQAYFDRAVAERIAAHVRQEQAEIDNTRYFGSASFCALSKSVANGGDVCDGRKCVARHEKDGGGIFPMTACAAIPKPSNLLSFPGSASSSSPTGKP
jgi:hypothetical protein